MTNLIPYGQTNGVMPTVDLGNQQITAHEFFGFISQHAPLALQHERWLYLAKMAFLENRADALTLAKQQAFQIQRGQLGNAQGGMMQYPSTYPQPQYQQPQPIIFSPQITVNPTIAPTFQNTANPHQSNRAETQQPTPQPYYTTTDLSIWQFVGLLFATAAIVILVL